LGLSGTQISDKGLEQLPALPKLSGISLGRIRITDAGMKHLVTHKGLTSIDLSFAALVTDAGIRELTSLQFLSDLELSGTRVTDSGLMSLAEAKKLKRLSVTLTRVTPKGIDELKNALPNCKVWKKEFNVPLKPR
jgi:hypothetical protein